MNAYRILAGVVLLTLASTQLLLAQPEKKKVPSREVFTVEKATVEKILAEWPGRPLLTARRTIEKFGLPQEATMEKLVWHYNRPWKRTVITRKEIPHDFPKLHMDCLQMTINYSVPAKAVDALVSFDGSVIYDRTAGELSSRCDVEAANILTLNLCHDIVTGKKDVTQAREAFGQAEIEFSQGKEPAIMKQLQFETSPESTADPDVPVIAGSSRRAEKKTIRRNRRKQRWEMRKYSDIS